MLKKTNPLIPKYAIKPLALALLVNSCVYMGIAQLRRFLTFSSLETPLDTALPFLAPFVLFYVLAFVQWGLNYLLIARDGKELCYRFAFGNIIAKLICLFFFVFLPTTLARPEVTGTDLCSRLVRLIYTFDPPVNLFPSTASRAGAASVLPFCSRSQTALIRPPRSSCPWACSRLRCLSSSM